MKNIFSSLAKRFQRFANSSSRDTEPVSSPEIRVPPRAKHAFESHPKTASASVAQTSRISLRPGGVHSQPATRKPNEAMSVNSFEFITRQELKRELDVLRRLIESRK